MLKRREVGETGAFAISSPVSGCIGSSRFCRRLPCCFWVTTLLLGNGFNRDGDAGFFEATVPGKRAVPSDGTKSLAFFSVKDDTTFKIDGDSLSDTLAIDEIQEHNDNFPGRANGISVSISV